MARVSSNLEVTIPEDLARECGIKPGDEVEVSKSETGLRITPVLTKEEEIARRLKWFHEAMRRQDERQAKMKLPETNDRGWTREDLYDDRGLAR